MIKPERMIFMNKLQLFATVFTLAMMLLSGCARSNVVTPSTVPVAVTEAVTVNPDAALAAYDALLAGTELPVNSDTWWIPDFQDDDFIYVYTHLDLDGDGVPELLVQVENDPLAYNGVFHYEDGQIFCWNSDAADGSQWESPLSDGSVVSCHYFGGVRSYTLFRYQPDGTREVFCDMFAREELIPEDSTEPCPYYEIDREEVDQAVFEKKLAELVTDRALDSSVWTTV